MVTAGSGWERGKGVNGRAEMEEGNGKNGFAGSVEDEDGVEGELGREIVMRRGRW